MPQSDNSSPMERLFPLPNGKRFDLKLQTYCRRQWFGPHIDGDFSTQATIRFQLLVVTV